MYEQVLQLIKPALTRKITHYQKAHMLALNSLWSLFMWLTQTQDTGAGKVKSGVSFLPVLAGDVFPVWILKLIKWLEVPV